MADRIKAVFLGALDTPTDQLSAYLDRTCEGDAEVRRRVEALLRAHQTPDDLLDRPVLRTTPGPDGLPTPGGLPVPPNADPEPAAGPADCAGRVRLTGEIARGGMGAVLRGHDPELGREVAVKVVLPEHRNNPALVHRFVGEARLAGRLQHPGIMPVYDVGRMADGRPFFAMKLVLGRTLADLLAARPDPAHDLARFLRDFERVCEAVGYAHARGVIHRDLKPLNVMVGAFGEVQVMDWGLAKEVGESPEAGSEPPPPASSPLPTPLTRAGEVVGSPGYLAPEQARGLPGDRRTDVFSLGAVLCEILTGGPPFRGASPLGLLHQAREGDLSDAAERLHRCGADPELTHLATDCLAADPAGRPADGSAVAARLAAYQTGVQERLRRAEIGQARAETRAEGERTRRRLAVGLTAAVLAVLALGGGTLLLVQRHAAEQDGERVRRRQAAESALARSADLRHQGRWDEARAVLEQARERLDDRDGEVAGEVRRAAAEAELVGRLEKVRLRAATWTGRSFENARADREYEAEFRAAGLGSPTDAADAVAGRVRDSGVRDALVAALDDWAVRTPAAPRRDWVRSVARAAGRDDGDWGRQVRASWADAAALARLAREAPTDRPSPHLLSSLAHTLADKQEAVRVLRTTQLRHPGDFWLLFTLAEQLARTGRYAEAAEFYRAALAARPGTTAVLVNLGVVLEEQKRGGEARDCFRRAIDLDPGFAPAHSNLGIELARQGRLDEAIASHRKAVDLDPEFTEAHTNLGSALAEKGKADEAIACYRRAIDLDPRHAPSHYGLGIQLGRQDRVAEAIASHRKVVDLDPTHAQAHYNLGIDLGRTGKVDESIASFRRAVDLDPGHAEARCNLGGALQERGDFADALVQFRHGHDLGRRRGDWAYPSDTWVRDCERLVEREKQLLGVLSGSSRPADAREHLEWAELCVQTRRYAAAARLFAGAFEVESQLAADLATGHRYRAATAAARAGAGQGRDAGPLTGEARAALRRHALDWLKADLTARRRLDAGDPRAHALRNWRADAALAGVRDGAELAKLPQAEAAAWREFWVEVARP